MTSGLTLTPEARERIRSALATAVPPGRRLRIHARREGGRLAYRLQAVGDEEVAAEDARLPFEGFEVVLDPDSAEILHGTTVDYRSSLLESGFVFDNPNAPRSPVLPTGSRSDLAGPVADRVRTLLDTEINPAIAAHGGRVSLVEVREGRVYLAFGGGCHGCGMVDVTLKQGIETRIREVLPDVVEVVDTTDHAAGANPYS